MTSVEKLEQAVASLREAAPLVAALSLEQAVAATRLADEVLSLAVAARQKGRLGRLLLGGREATR